MMKRHELRLAHGALIAAILVLAGCTKTIKFRVVDEQTKKPVPGVKVIQKGHLRDLLFGSKDETRELGVGDDGVVVAPGLKSGWFYHFSFDAPSYQGSGAYLTTGSQLSVWTPTDAPEGKRTPADRATVVEVTLHRKRE